MADETELEKKKAEEYLTRLKYLQAEFDNYRKRVEKEREEFAKYATERLVRQLLDVYENLERALENGANEDKEALLKGVEMTFQQLKDVLEKEGLEPIKTQGVRFDPFLHEAVLQEEREDCDEGTVLEEYQRGYTLNKRVLRYSKVKVAKKKEVE
ncbi:MAG: nucleotide exchange factor GrpE [Euryarchaeota archaeon]|nr:nucleotide exchange factor GrpE [Euryarchaeota archaeon]